MAVGIVQFWGQMKAQTYNITKKKKWFPESVASINDFKLKPGQEIEASEILDNSNISIYCLDIKNERVIFVETSSGVDLASSVFVYHAQYKNAWRIITLSFRDAVTLSGLLPAPDRNIIFLYTTGRAGSTLLCKMFEKDPDTISLSEPDILVPFIALFKENPGREEELEALLLACMKMLFADKITKGRKNILIKTRGLCIELMPVINKIFPRSKAIFLYRNALPVVTSFIRAFTGGRIFHLLMNSRPGRKFMQYMFRKNYDDTKMQFPYITKEQIAMIGQTGIAGVLCISWLSMMKSYCAFYHKGVRSFALIYEDIINHSRNIITELFQYCGIPVSSVDIALTALEKDSQEGTRLSRSSSYKKQGYVKKIDPEILEKILEKEPEINSIDFIVPGTVKPHPEGR